MRDAAKEMAAQRERNAEMREQQKLERIALAEAEKVAEDRQAGLKRRKGPSHSARAARLRTARLCS
jgi:hypothetical protein